MKLLRRFLFEKGLFKLSSQIGRESEYQRELVAMNKAKARAVEEDDLELAIEIKQKIKATQGKMRG